MWHKAGYPVAGVFIMPFSRMHSGAVPAKTFTSRISGEFEVSLWKRQQFPVIFRS